MIDLIPTNADLRIYHVYNSEVSASWQNIQDWLRCAGLSFETVSTQTWLDKLRNSAEDLDANPSRKLLGFWEDVVSYVDNQYITNTDQPL